jgi:murein DD-endopeptidase MepM/ murein hydrolase activator NlpD
MTWLKRGLPIATLLFVVAALLAVRRPLVALIRYRQPPRELVVPVAGVAREKLESSWGAPRSGHRQHHGIDIFARRGTPILAAAPGVVVRIGHDRLGGNVVWVAGAGARLYYYAHLDAYRPGLSVGEEVEAGRWLGRVGTTGNAQGTPPHLHFGVYPAAQLFRPVDPTPLLRAHAD